MSITPRSASFGPARRGGLRLLFRSAPRSGDWIRRPMPQRRHE